MNIIAVEDEKLLLAQLETMLRQVFIKDHIIGFADAEQSLAFVKQMTEKGEMLNYAFLDISLIGMTGITLAKLIRERQPHCIVIFCTGHTEYAFDAFSVGGVAYLTKPVNKEELINTLKNIQDMITPDNRQRMVEKEPHGKLRIQTCGNFEVYYEGKKVLFERQKAKEMLAYLIDRRMSAVTNAELAKALWDDRDRTENVRTVRASLIKIMKEIGMEHVIIRSRNQTSVDFEYLDCDINSYLQGEESKTSAFLEKEYMSNYPWANKKIK